MLIARLATAIVVVPILAAVVWLGGPIFLLVAALAAGVASHEAASLFLLPPRRYQSIAVLGAVGLVLGAGLGTQLVLVLTALYVFASMTLSLVPLLPDEPRRPPNWGAALNAGLYAGLPLALLVLLRATPGADVRLAWLTVPLPRGVAWIAVTFTIAFAVDTVAYAAGRLVGRHPLWPRVSPKKTREGTVAGFLAGVLVGLAWSAPLRLGTAPSLVLGVSVATGAILGDLVESALKRAAGAKDSGAIFPGHGGLLDRLDSLSFAIVVVFLIVTVVHG